MKVKEMEKDTEGILLYFQAFIYAAADVCHPGMRTHAISEFISQYQAHMKIEPCGSISPGFTVKAPSYIFF